MDLLLTLKFIPTFPIRLFYRRLFFPFGRKHTRLTSLTSRGHHLPATTATGSGKSTHSSSRDWSGSGGRV